MNPVEYISGQAIRYPKRTLAWYALSILVLASMMSFVDKNVLYLLVAPVRHDLGISDTHIGLLQGLAFVLFYSVAGVPIGVLTDRHSRRVILTVGVALWSVMTVLCGLAQSFDQLFLARVGVGVGEAAVVPVAYSMIPDLFPPGFRSRALGLFTSSYFTGGAFSIFLTGFVLQVLGDKNVLVPFLGLLHPWQLTFIGVGAPGLLVALLLLTTIEPKRQEETLRRMAPGGGGELLELVKRHRRGLSFLFATYSIAGFSALAVVPSIPTILIRRFGLTGAEVGVMFGISAMFSAVLGSVLGGFFGDVLIRRKLSGTCFRVPLVWWVSAPVLTLVAARTDTLWVCVAAFVIFYSMNAFWVASIPASIQEVAPNQLRGKISAVQQLMLAVFGFALGPVATAFVSEHLLHDDAAIGLAAALVLIPACVLGLIVNLCGLQGFEAARISIQRKVHSEQPPAE